MTRRQGTDGAQGLAEDLQYDQLLSEPGAAAVVSTRRGGLLGGLWVEGPDLFAAPASEVQARCRALHAALEPLGHQGEWMLHFEAVRRKVHSYLPRRAEAHPADVVCDEERRQGASHFDTRHAVFATFLGTSEDMGLLGTVEGVVRGRLSLRQALGLGEEGSAEVAAQRMLEVLRRFEQDMARLERGLRAAGMQVRRMQTEEDNCQLLQALNGFINGVWHPVRPTSFSICHLNVLLARELVAAVTEEGGTATYGGQAFRVVEPLRFGPESWANMLRVLEDHRVQWRRSVRVIFLGRERSTGELELRLDRWNGMRTRLRQFGKKKQDDRRGPARAADQVEESLSELEEASRFGAHVTTAVVVQGKDDAEAVEHARVVERAFHDAGFAAATQAHNTRQAFLGSLPGHSEFNVRRPFFDSLNVVHLTSMSREWGGEDTVPSRLYPPNSPPLMQVLSRSGARFFLNPHKAPDRGAQACGSRKEDLAHMALIGPSGAGKSAALSAIVSQFLARYDGQAVVFDNGHSAYKLTLCRGEEGLHFDFEGTGRRLNPLGRMNEPVWQAFANDFVAGLVQRQGGAFGERERFVLAQALRALSRGPADDRNLGTLWRHINEPLALKRALQHYVAGGGDGVVDGTRDGLGAGARLTTFELRGLLRRDETVTRAALHYVLQHVRSVADGRPTLLVVDEARLAVEDTMLTTQLAELLAHGRRDNMHVVLVFHSPADLLDTPLATQVATNVPTRLWLPNPGAGNPKLRRGYEELGADDALIRQIVDAQPKLEYIYQSGGYRRVFSMELGPVQQALWTHRGEDDLQLVRELSQTFGDCWPREYLRRQGLREASETFERLYNRRREGRGAARGVA